MPTVPDYYIKERSFSITDICLLTAKALNDVYQYYTKSVQ